MSLEEFSYRRILRIVWPVIVSQMSFTAMGIIDTIMVGRLGVTALAAVGLANFLSLWFLCLFWGLLAAVNTLVAQAVGAEKLQAAGAAFRQGVYLAAIAGLAMAVLAPWVPILLRWTDASPEVQQLAADYMRIRFLGAAAATFMWAGENFYRGLGETRVPMICGVVQAILNCLFNYLLIFGKAGLPALGCEGAALGTVIAQGAVAIVLLSTVFLRPRFKAFEIRQTWRPSPEVFGKTLRLGFPIGIQAFMEMGGVAVFCALVARLGDAQMAATNAVIQAWSVAYMGAAALSVGATTVVGQSVGAGDPEMGRRAVRRILWLGVLLSATLGAIYLAFPSQLLALFVEQEDVAQILPFAAPLFLVVTVCLLPDLMFNVLAGALRGAGDTAYPMWVNIGSAWLLFVPASYFASLHLGLVATWWCFLLHTGVMATLLWRRFVGSRWVERLSVLVPSGVSAVDSESSASPA